MCAPPHDAPRAQSLPCDVAVDVVRVSGCLTGQGLWMWCGCLPRCGVVCHAVCGCLAASRCAAMALHHTRTARDCKTRAMWRHKALSPA